MFIYFNQNKCAYHKGQLAPFFIVLIIVIIIAGLVTINVGKIAKTKTSSANAADAGVLAAASTMASAFNYIAVANSNMEVNYQYFIGLATVSFIIGYVVMASAMASTATAIVQLAAAASCQACCSPWSPGCCVCWWVMSALAIGTMTVAQGSLKLFSQTMTALIVQVTGYWMLQFFFYKMIRDNIDSYHQSAIDSGYSFAFNNSGISSKLNDQQRENYKEWLKNNIKDVPSGSILTYSWLDGQDRSHDVATQVIIDPVEDYVLRHTILPFPAEVALLATSMIFTNTASVKLAAAIGTAFPAPAAAGVTAGAAQVSETVALITSIAAHVGLAPNGTITSSSGSGSWPYLITWIDDVHHNFLVDVYQTQRNQGADLGVWTTEYPIVTSSSRANFAGTGSVYPPNAHYDATIILTDFLASHLLDELIEPIKDVEGEIQAGLIGNNDDNEEEEEVEDETKD